jgi:flagellar protein FlbD
VNFYEGEKMITLTKFQSKDEFVLNSDLIETIEETPDTVVTLTSGRKLIVEEAAKEIIKRILEFRRELGKFTR